MVTSTTAAHADGWLTAELPAAAAVSGMQEQAFRAGAMPAAGAYLDSGRFAFGVRLRAGVLRDGSAPPGNLRDPSTGGLATAGVAARLGVNDGWAELVAGGGITGHDAVPAFEAGVGWSFAVGSVGLGPSVRYMRVVASGGEMLGSADLVLVGVDVQLGRHHAEPVPHVVEEPPPPVAQVEPPPPPEPPPAESDEDKLDDAELSCADFLEAGDPTSGCPANDAITVVDDHIILDDRVLFDTDRAHVKAAGRELIAKIADAWKQHPEWKSMTVEGHADVRGADDYNMQLSQLRAERARAELLKHGFDPDSVKAIGYGRTRPRYPGTDEVSHEKNRRVEFVIERGQP
jgi:outer membrane protein OmpA-like peptidoglycan-associated protein